MWSDKYQRFKMIFIIYGCVFFVGMMIRGVLVPASENDNARNESKDSNLCDFNITLKGYTKMSIYSRRDISSNYVKCNSLPETAVDQIDTCLSDMAHNKNDELTVYQVLDWWCGPEFKDDPTLLEKKYVNYNKIELQFHPWDGSHLKLEKYIKQSMNDEDSYKHVETRYRLVSRESDRYLLVSTIFSGNNAFGGRVKSSVLAKVDIKTGDVIEVLE